MAMLIRKAQVSDAREIAIVHVESWRSTYGGIVSDAFLSAMTYDEREARWHVIFSGSQERIVYVAQDEAGKVVGFAMGGPHRDKEPECSGELYSVYLLAEYQGYGLGRQLVQAVATDLLQAKHRSMIVWVLSENRARHFYENLGATYLLSKEAQIGEQQLSESAYVWWDLESSFG